MWGLTPDGALTILHYCQLVLTAKELMTSLKYQWNYDIAVFHFSLLVTFITTSNL